MAARQIPLDAVAYNTLVDGFARCGDFDSASNMLREMEGSNHPPGTVTYNSLITGFGKCGRVEEAVKLFHSMLERNVRRDTVTYNALMSAYLRVNDIESAVKVVADMKANKIRYVWFYTKLSSFPRPFCLCFVHGHLFCTDMSCTVGGIPQPTTLSSMLTQRRVISRKCGPGWSE